MERHYEHYLHTGSGWTHAVLSFWENNTATIYFDARWMGSELNRCRFTLAHFPQSHDYGFFSLNTIERYIDRESDKTIIEDLNPLVNAPDNESQELYRDITYEYIALPKSQIWLADGPDIEQMAGLGLARWHDSFDLVLLLHFSVALITGKLDKTKLGAALKHLDKMKFKTIAKPVFGYPRIQELTKRNASHSDNEVPF